MDVKRSPYVAEVRVSLPWTSDIIPQLTSLQKRVDKTTDSDSSLLFREQQGQLKQQYVRSLYARWFQDAISS
jgi:hypothetical protein